MNPPIPGASPPGTERGKPICPRVLGEPAPFRRQRMQTSPVHGVPHGRLHVQTVRDPGCLNFVGLLSVGMGGSFARTEEVSAMTPQDEVFVAVANAASPRRLPTAWLT